MLIEEIIRTCANENVAKAAVVSLGTRFAGDVEDTALACGLTIGSYAARSVERFARDGDEATLRAVIAAMQGSQEPLLAGLHRILSSRLAADVPPSGRRRRAVATLPCRDRAYQNFG
jgi:hypothetical protein